jgi:hypothetical protein
LKENIIKGMIDKINAIGISKVSNHAGDPTKLSVIDVAPSSIQNKAKFEEEIRKNKDAGFISRYIFPPDDPAYHIEIPIPQNP